MKWRIVAAYHIHVVNGGREQLKNIFTHGPQSIVAHIISFGRRSLVLLNHTANEYTSRRTEYTTLE